MLFFFQDDHSRVVLDNQSGEHSDYINANYIEVSQKYIFYYFFPYIYLYNI